MSLAVLCPGQGSQHPAMLDLLAENHRAEAILAEAHEALGVDLREWLARPEEIFRNAIAQPLLCASEMATWAALQEHMPEPIAFAGYSVGELAAYGCAGALDARELAGLARVRAQAMDAAAVRPSGLMAMRGLGRDDLERLIAESQAWIAIVNGEDAFVVGGEAIALDRLEDRARSRGADVTRLNVGLASHTPLLGAAVAPFRSALEHSALAAPAPPVVAGIDASWVTARERAVATLAAQIAAPLEWAACLDTLYERGCRVYLELGPGCALARMVRGRLPQDVEARSVSEFRSLEAAAAWVSQRC